MLLNLKGVFYQLFHNPVFVIYIRDGKISKQRGIVKSGFKADCMEIIKQNRLKDGIIFCSKNSFGNLCLTASSEIPQEVLQQLRNAWGFY